MSSASVKRGRANGWKNDQRIRVVSYFGWVVWKDSSRDWGDRSVE